MGKKARFAIIALAVSLVLALGVLGICLASAAATPAASVATTAPAASALSAVAGAGPPAAVLPSDLHLSSVAGKSEPKLQSSLTELVRTEAESGPAAAADFGRQHGMPVDQGRVTVVIEAAAGQGNAARALAAGQGAIEATHGDLVQASVPVDSIPLLSASGAVSYVRQPDKPFPYVTSEGVSDIGASTWQSAGYYGTGEKIAVIDPGFQNYQTMEASGELPANTIVKSFRADGDITGGGSTHGTACAEIVHDVAPGAQLYLVNFDTDVELGSAIDYLISQHVDVVSASWGFFGEYQGNGQGSIDDMVQNARNNGIFWANAAGNAAMNHWQGPFADNGSGWTKFSGSDTTNSFYSYAGDSIDVFLTWNKWPVTDQDYDIYLYNNLGQQVGAGNGPQTGTQPPTEEIHFVAPSSTTYYVRIQKYGANNTGDASFQLFVMGPGSIHYQVAASSLGGEPTDAAAAMTAGAVAVNTTSLETFSSRGPTLDGRTKPDITAPDRVSTATFGTTGFWGTSASAPHLAGAGALVKQMHPGYTPDSIQSFLEGRALDLGAVGKDNLFGSGKLELGPLPPTVISVQPSGNVNTTSATIAAYYQDNSGTGINASAVSLSLDSNLLSGCSVTATYIACQADNLSPGAHTITGSVADNNGGVTSINGSFNDTCSPTQLTLQSPQAFWESYSDYLAGQLSVTWTLNNGGSSDAQDVQIVGSINSNGVAPLTPLPVGIGTIASGSSASATLKYSIPPSISVFKSLLYVTASNTCGTYFSFPGPYPGA